MKEFTLLGTTLRYSTQRLNYYSIHSVFLKLAKESWKQFYTDYQKMGNLSKAYEQLPTVIAAVFRRIDSACEDHIKRQDIYSVKANDIRNHCQSALHEIRQVYQERIVAPYQAIDERKKAEAAQREFKKKVKANDLWDNLGYSALNAVGNLGSSLNASLDANSVYKNSDTLDRFKNAILDYTILAEHTTMRLIEENSNIAYDEPNSSEVSKLQNITDNILNGTVPSEKQDEMILDVLQGNPHAFELYDLLVKKYGDADGTLEDMATCFGYSDFVTYKLNLLKEKFSKELSATYTEEQDILDLKKQIEAFAIHLKVDPAEPLAPLKAQWDSIDRDLRTAGGKEYETREEAQNVRDDIALRNQQAARYDLYKVNFQDPAQANRFVEILRDLPYKSTDVPEGLPEFVSSITRDAADRCAVIESLAAPDNLPGHLSAAWARFPIYNKIAGKLKFGADGMSFLQKYADRWSLEPDEKLCICQDISRLLSPGKVLVITNLRFCVIQNKDVAQFSLDQIQAIQGQDNGCMVSLKNQPAYQTPFLVNLPAKEMELYVRLLNYTVQGLQLTGIPREQIYVSIDSEEALSADPQPLVEQSISVASHDAATAMPSPAPAATVNVITSDNNAKQNASSADKKKFAYAKALAACGGTPEGILSAYESAMAERAAASNAYNEQLTKNPQAKTAHTLSMIFLLGVVLGVILIFAVSLPVGVGVFIASVALFSFFDTREKKSMAASSSAEARQAKLRQEQAEEALKTCRAYLNAKKEAEESGITVDDVKELISTSFSEEEVR